MAHPFFPGGAEYVANVRGRETEFAPPPVQAICYSAISIALWDAAASRRAAAPTGRRGHRHRRAGVGRRVPRGERGSVVVVV